MKTTIDTQIGELCQDLRKMVQGHFFIQHPLFDKMKGVNGLSYLRAFAHVQYGMSVSLASAFAALAARTPVEDWRQRVTIMDLAAEETWGLGPHNHGRAFEQFIAAIDLDLSDLENEGLHSVVRDAARLRVDIARGDLGHSLAAGALALAYANEYANLFIFGKLRFISDRLMSNSDGMKYFSDHISDESEHSAALIEFAEHYGKDIDIPEAMDATQRLLDARARVFDLMISRAEQNRFQENLA